MYKTETADGEIANLNCKPLNCKPLIANPIADGEMVVLVDKVDRQKSQ